MAGYRGSIPKLVVPPVGGWTPLNLRGGQDSITPTADARSLVVEAVAGVSYRGEHRAAPATPYHVFMQINVMPHAGEMAVSWRESDTGKLQVVTWAHPPTAPTQNGQQYTDESNFFGNTPYTSNFNPANGSWWVLENDGVNLRWALSADRATVGATFGTVAVASFMASAGPDQIFWGGYPGGTGRDLVASLIDYDPRPGTIF